MSNLDSGPIVIPADPNDPEDFDVTEAALERGLKCRRIRMARHASGMTQAQFAAAFRIPIGTLRDWEQSRSTPPDFAMVYVALIERDPTLVAELAKAA